jgi:tyrosine decarboxylase/aspartate 1-decarboxylase
MRPKWVSLTDDFTIDIDAIQEKIDKQTVGLVGIAGTTGTGACDNIQALSEIAIDNSLYLHVDAAFGGLIFPFLQQLNRSAPVFDFLHEGVNSITIDTHKLLGSLIPGGSIIFRSSQFSKLIGTRISYLADATTEQITITGTRPAAPVIASWVLLKKLGSEFIINRVRQSLELTDYLITGLRSLDKIILPFEPTINIVGFRNKVLSNKKLQSKLWKQNWKLSLYSDWARIVVMPHLVKATIDAFLKDLSVILSGDE